VLTDESPQPSGTPWSYPGGEWKAKNGNMFQPYAAGIPGKIRFIYVPCLSLFCHAPPTVLGLEQGVRYYAYYWEPTLGVKFDLGSIERPAPGAVLLNDDGADLAIHQVSQQDLVASVAGLSNASAGLILRYHDSGNYLTAVYSPTAKAVYLLDREKGVNGDPLGSMPVGAMGTNCVLSAEVRGPWAAVSITDGTNTYTSKIVAVSNTTAGGAGLWHESGSPAQSFTHFELRKSPTLVTDDHLEKKLYDARGTYRGTLTGKGWDDFGKEKIILLDAYQPTPLPMPQDWILVLANVK
jgi:hypothetical protein